MFNTKANQKHFLEELYHTSNGYWDLLLCTPKCIVNPWKMVMKKKKREKMWMNENWHFHPSNNRKSVCKCVLAYCVRSVQCVILPCRQKREREREIKDREEKKGTTEGLSESVFLSHQLQPGACAYTLQMRLIYIKITHTSQTYTDPHNQSLWCDTNNEKKQARVFVHFHVRSKEIPFFMVCITVTVL